MPADTTQTDIKQGLPIIRADGVNESERYLKRLCDRSFLSLWSYPRPFRNEELVKANGTKQEICDLIVVFGTHVLIFQDKKVDFTNTGNLETDWRRWYREAIVEGAKKVWGGEKWLKKHPDNVYLDKDCTQPFPIALPDPADAQYHRIIVAHGASERCRQERGGSGSLKIGNNTVADPMPDLASGEIPFTIGQVNSAKGFVHIFDDTTLDIVLQTLDTAPDFIAYLTKKEQFCTSGRFGGAAGEEELLAEYLKHRNTNEEHDFVYPADGKNLNFPAGGWDNFNRSSRRSAQVEANEISYEWDALIEEFSRQNMAGTLEGTNCLLQEIEPAIRFMASENRTRRRLLWNAFSEVLVDAPENKAISRIVLSYTLDKHCYVFLGFPYSNNYSYERNREARRLCLLEHLPNIKITYPNVQHIVGIAVVSGPHLHGSVNLVYADMKEWTAENQAKALQRQKSHKLLNNTDLCLVTADEYPAIQPDTLKPIAKEITPINKNYLSHKIGRNQPCPCGSGKKYKFCCGR